MDKSKKNPNDGWFAARDCYPKEGENVFAYWVGDDHKPVYGLAYYLVGQWYVFRKAELKIGSTYDWEAEDVLGWIPIPKIGEYRDVADISMEPAVKPDAVNHPAHYKSAGGLECIDAMIAAMGIEKVRNGCECNTFKYIWRHDKKGGLEDMEKARWYIDKYIELSRLIEESKDD